MNDKISTFWTLKQLKAAGKYDEGGKHEKLAEATTISIEQGFLGFTAKGGDKYPYMDDFVLQFNKEIYMIRRSGELQQIIDDFIK